MFSTVDAKTARSLISGPRKNEKTKYDPRKDRRNMAFHKARKEVTKHTSLVEDESDISLISLVDLGQTDPQRQHWIQILYLSDL